MQSKYLPIGTIVKVKNLKKDIMITGYYSLEYQNSVKIFDYSGCVYPEGFLAKNNSFSFNHSDILSVEFMGYVNETFNILNNNLNGQLESSDKNMNKPANSVNYKFDENGVVIYEELKEAPKGSSVELPKLTNPFKIADNTSRVDKTPDSKREFLFDDNGVITEDNIIKEEKEKIESNFKYLFDDNGVVIGVQTITDKNVEEKPQAKYEFDASGMIISDGSNVKEENSKETSNIKYTFDKNGTIIDTNESSEKQEKTSTQYKFDENGVIIE